jgi:hypothetical protein
MHELVKSGSLGGHHLLPRVRRLRGKTVISMSRKLVVWPGEQPSSRIDAPSLILIALVLGVCLLTSLWAAFSGADLGANLL